MRRFIGYRPEPPADYIERGVAAPPDQPQYEGVVFTDGSVALRWRTEYKSTSVWTCYQDFYHVHGHPEYGTRIEWLDNMHTTEARIDRLEREVGHYERMLGAFCPCDLNPGTSDGPQQDCPIHGDGVTFARWISDLQNELAARRASVTTGGPPAAFTQDWERGDSSRPPTAPPEDEVVELPDDTDMTQEEFRASAAQGTPVRIVASREEFVEAIPVSDEERAEMQPVHPHGNPYNCPCPNEAPDR